MIRKIVVCLALACINTLAACVACAADVSSAQMEYAGSGRFDLLEKLMETEAAKGPLNTRDRHALCFAYSKTKRYDRLMPCLDQLEKGMTRTDRRTRLFGLDDATPAIRIMRAEAQLELAQYGAAAREARLALDWLRKEKSDDDDMEINALAVLSMSATLSGDKDNGRKHAVEIERIRTTAYAGAKAMALGRVYLALGDYKRALDGVNSDRTFKLRAFLDNLASGALLRGVNNWAWAELPRGFMINKALLETGEVEQAKTGYDKLLSIPQSRNNGEIYWLILDDRGRIAEREGDIKAAIGFYQRAIDVIEQQRASINTEANKIGFVGDKQGLYSRLINLLYRSQSYSEAFEYMERAKARALVDMLAGKEEFALPPNAAAETAALLKSYREAEQEARVQLPMDANRTPSGQSATRVLQIKALTTAAPELASLVSVAPVTLAEIQKLLPPDTILAEYYLMGQDFYVAVVTAASVRTVRLDAAGLEDNIRRLRKLLGDRDNGTQKLAQALYRQLITPIEADLGERKLLVIPHGVLHYLPFSALHDGTGYLVQKRALHYLPSASTLKFLRPGSGKGIGSILILGNPDLDNREYDLPSAQEEAIHLAKMLPNSELLLRDKATKSAFTRFAPSFPFLHVASHGQFDADKPLGSRLLLRGEGGGDGSLTVSELYGLRLNAELITLSACETGLGKVLSGDDLVGLTRGFLYAGGRNIVSSLWEVDDASTSYLMQAFYTRMNNGQPKLEALRQAQLETLGKYPHPFFWAAFGLTGRGD